MSGAANRGGAISGAVEVITGAVRALTADAAALAGIVALWAVVDLVTFGMVNAAGASLNRNIFAGQALSMLVRTALGAVFSAWIYARALRSVPRARPTFTAALPAAVVIGLLWALPAALPAAVAGTGALGYPPNFRT